MPIYLEWLDEPSEQDRKDLEKLYADAPSEWLSEENETSAVDWALGRVSAGDKIALGRFNDRIVSAARLIKGSESSCCSYTYQIQQLCVRKVTRDRGVAKQLLVRLCQWATEQSCDVYIEDKLGELSALYELRFVQYSQGWRFTPL